MTFIFGSPLDQDPVQKRIEAAVAAEHARMRGIEPEPPDPEPEPAPEPVRRRPGRPRKAG